ncbi:MAG TPA: tetratricopeptide repeat protein, partial [bacterium]|nr:tetratricopeptide repeat protein [bacterium]
GEMLGASPGIKILATSRVALRLLWEQEVPLDPLGTGDGAPAVRLFAERAKAIRPDFTVTPANASLIAGICERADGLPLAIELAAAQTRYLTLPALLERMERRLEALTEGPRDLPPRHQTLRTAIAWTYDTLTPARQMVFRGLSVFAGGFSPDAAHAVIGGEAHDAIAAIAGLVDQNLIRPSSTAADEPRFEILESLREFGLEQLRSHREADETFDRHFDFFFRMVEKAAPGLRRHDQLAWLDRLDWEQDNLRTAVAWCGDHRGVDAALRMAAGLRDYWVLRARPREGLAWFTHLLETGEAASPAALLRAHSAMALLAVWSGQLRWARELSDRCIGLNQQAADKPSLAEALRVRARVAVEMEGDSGQALNLLDESLALHRALGDEAGIGVTLSQKAWSQSFTERWHEAESIAAEAMAIGRRVGDRYTLELACNAAGALAFRRGDLRGAQRAFADRLAFSRELGNAVAVTSSLGNLGVLAAEQEDYATAEACFAEAVHSAREAGDVLLIGGYLESLGNLYEAQGKYREAAVAYRQHLERARERGDLVGAYLAEDAAGIAAATGQPVVAARLLGAAEARREDKRRPIFYASIRRLQERRIGMARGALGESEFAAAWAAGRAMAFEDALAEAGRILHSVPTGGAPPDGEERTSPLTRREEEVAGLIAQGMSNRGIARRLFISKRTADTHVQHILNKLGFNSRVQIAAWAVQRGLTASR